MTAACPGSLPAHSIDAASLRADPRGRRVRALLIAGDQPDAPGTSTAGAVEAITVIAHDLAARFTTAEVTTLRAAPSRQAVTAALARCLAATDGDDLLVIMYAGHGAEPTADCPTEGWLLSAGEVFSDVDLAAALAAAGPSVDVVVIAACCYGEGFFIPGPGLAATPALPLRPMICIAAATAAGSVTLSKLVELARAIVSAADAGHSYGDLARRFAQHAFTGHEFRVGARPAERLADRVFDTARRTADARAMRPLAAEIISEGACAHGATACSSGGHR